MNEFFSSTKGKVITGFGIAALVLLTALYFSIASFREISVATDELARPNSTQLYLNQLLSRASEAESQVRAYTLTQDNAYLESYEQNTAAIFSILDTLALAARSEERKIRQIDSLRLLMNHKVKGLNDFMSLKIQNDERTFSERAIQQLNRQAQNEVQVKKALKKTETQISEAQQPLPRVEIQSEEKRGLLNRIFGRDKSEPRLVMPDSQIVTTSSTISIDTIVVSQAAADSLIQRMRSVLGSLQREELLRRRQLTGQELTLLQEDSRIMRQINGMIRKLERDEVAKTKRQAREARRVADNASLLIFMLSCTGLLCSFVFFLLIVRDISRSNYYKQRLEAAKQRAEELGRIKAQFLANMSHEIRTPLHAILGFSNQLSQETVLPREQAEQLEAIRSSSGFLLSLVNDILDLSKIEAGKLRFEQKAFALNDTLQQTVRMMKPRAAENELDLQVFLPEEEIYLQGDAYRLQQILFNLLSNGLKFTEKGWVRLVCSAADNGFGKAVVRMQIRDTGIGIPKEQLDKIFDNFSQADESVTRRFGGTGLGLSITQKLVKLMGGELQVESTPGEGTTFFISLPFNIADKSAVRFDTEQDIQPKQLHWPQARVLVADDDPINRKLLQHMLRKHQIQADFVENGLQAWEKVQQAAPYHLLLTDIHMPEMGGPDLVVRLREAGYDLPIVAITANAMPEDSKRYLAAGMSDILIKPFNELELSRILLAQLPAPDTSEEPLQPVSTAPASSWEEILIADEECEESFTLEAFAQYANGDVQTLHSFISFFIDNLNQNLIQLKEHIEKKEWREAGELSHKMYPAVKQLGAHRMADTLKALELEALHNKAKPSRTKIRRLGEEVSECSKSLLGYLQRSMRSMQVQQP